MRSRLGDRVWIGRSRHSSRGAIRKKVIPALAAGIQLASSSGACAELDPGHKAWDDVRE